VDARLTHHSIPDLHRRFRDGSTTPEVLVEECLSTIDRLDPLLHAMITVDGTGAREAAAESTRRIATGQELRPLEGIPVAVKDVIPVRGMPTTHGVPNADPRPSAADALVVGRLRDAGAVLLGKSSTPEHAAYMNTRNDIVGTTLSPWDIRLSSGGSSGGSAVAVATGMAMIGIGTDHGGSVRFPAAMNGICGLRPTPGRIPVWPSSWVFDTLDTTGPLTRRCSDLQIVEVVLSGGTPGIPLGFPEETPGRAGTLADAKALWTCDFDGQIRVSGDVEELTRRAHATLTTAGLNTTSGSLDLTGAIASIRPLRSWRTLIVHAGKTSDDFTNPLLAQSVQTAAGESLTAVANAERSRSACFDQAMDRFAKYDFLVTPAAQVTGFASDAPAPQSIDGEPLADALDSCLSLYAFSVLGFACAVVPAGVAPDGMPVGLQIVGPPGSDRRVLRFATAVQETLGTVLAPPSLVG
jgi:amidase